MERKSPAGSRGRDPVGSGAKHKSGRGLRKHMYIQSLQLTDVFTKQYAYKTLWLNNTANPTMLSTNSQKHL